MALEKKKPKNGKVLRKILLKLVHRMDRQQELLQQITTLLATNNAGIQTEKDLSRQMLKLLEGIQEEARKLKKQQAKTNEYLERFEKQSGKLTSSEKVGPNLEEAL